MRGGKREGSGRKAVGSHKIAFVVPEEIYEWLVSYRQCISMSRVICNALREYMKLRKDI